MSNIIKSIEGRLNHYHDLLYTSPSDFKHVSAKSDMRYLLKEIETLQEENNRLECSLKEIKSISSMWDVRHSEDVTGCSTILELSRKALEQPK